MKIWKIIGAISSTTTKKMWDMVEDNAEIIEGLSKTYDSMLTNRTNEIMKVMTFISTLFLPLTFITGFYGMNVGLPLAENPWAYIIISVLMLCFLSLFHYVFHKKKMAVKLLKFCRNF